LTEEGNSVEEKHSIEEKNSIVQKHNIETEHSMRKEIVYTKVLLVGVDTGEKQDFDHSMDELKSLAEAAYKEVTGIIVQHMQAVNKAYYVGTGKVAEVKEYAMQCEAEEVVFLNSLSASQVRNLGRELELPVLDRTNLILDIFAGRAKTKEAKLQVETARLQYILPRLVGMRENLSRQGGTGGKGGAGSAMSNKGAGETKLELDRRKIEHRISELEKELDSIARNRETLRKKRIQSNIPKVALVGYTNAGKSTILNRMVELYGEKSEKTVLEEDMLFATLDTTVRCISSKSKDSVKNKPFFLVDTVGFINELPHGLVKAFRSTLEEVKYADLLVQVVDFSDEHYRQHMETTADTLKELGAGNIPQLVVYNKADKCHMDILPRIKDRQIYMAAALGIGIEELTDLIEECVYAQCVETEFLLSYDQGNIVSYFMEHATVLEQEYRENGVWLKVYCHKSDADKYCNCSLRTQ